VEGIVVVVQLVTHILIFILFLNILLGATINYAHNWCSSCSNTINIVNAGTFELRYINLTFSGQVITIKGSGSSTIITPFYSYSYSNYYCLYNYYGKYDLSDFSVQISDSSSSSRYFVYLYDEDTSLALTNINVEITASDSYFRFIYTDSGKINITSCTFSSIYCYYSLIYYNRFGTTNILDSTFQNINMSYDYPAIVSSSYFSSSSTDVFTFKNNTVNNIEFISTSSNGIDAGVFRFYSDYYLVFEDNTFSDIDLSINDGYGSVIYLTGSEYNLSYSGNIFYNISGTNANGAFSAYCSMSGTSTSYSLTISDSYFILCNSKYAGAVYFVGV
jgi:hypothetical protein